MIKLCELRETPLNLPIRLKDNPDLLVDKYLSDGWKIGRYVPSRRATTIESIGNEKDITE